MPYLQKNIINAVRRSARKKIKNITVTSRSRPLYNLLQVIMHYIYGKIRKLLDGSLYGVSDIIESNETIRSISLLPDGQEKYF